MTYLNDTDPEIMWGNATRDMEAFKMGSEAEGDNPFKPNTNKWYSWNAGKNMRE